MREITEEQAVAVYRILIDHVGAYDNPNSQWSFVYHVTHAKHPADEYRLSSRLGYGGKFRNNGNCENTPYVDCYPEHLTAERVVMLEDANLLIGRLFTQIS